MSILSRLLSLCPTSSGACPPAGPAAPVPTPLGAAGHPGYHTTSWLLRECVRFVHPSLPLFAAELRDRAAELEAGGD